MLTALHCLQQGENLCDRHYWYWARLVAWSVWEATPPRLRRSRSRKPPSSTLTGTAVLAASTGTIGEPNGNAGASATATPTDITTPIAVTTVATNAYGSAQSAPVLLEGCHCRCVSLICCSLIPLPTTLRHCFLASSLACSPAIPSGHHRQ